MLDGIDGNGFHIPVRATIDNLALRAPSGLDLGFCATHQTTSMVFKLENIGEIDAPYRWDIPPPFHLVPSQGVVPVGKYHEITVSIIPQDASVFVSQAVCYVGEGVHAIIPEPVITMKVSSIGKFAYINLSDALVSFEEVVSGTVPERKEIALINNSVVPAEFALIRLDNDRDEVFVIEPKVGVIPPQSEIAVTIDYRALAMGCYSRDRYAFRTPGNCNTILNLRGMSMPPRVMLYKDVPPSKENESGSVVNASMSALSLTGTLSAEEGAPLFSFNFRDVEIGKVATRIMYIRNDSHRAVPYCVIADEHGAFEMSPKQGIIPPLTKSFAVTLLFQPSKPMNYYRRFFVLVEDALPLFYDCMGTGFIRAKGEVKEQRPAPIRHAHVQAYRNRNGQGMGALSPDELDKLYENPEAPSSFFAQIGRVGTKALSITGVTRPVTRTGESVRTSVAPAHEFFVSDMDTSAREVISNKAQLNFGFSPYRATSQPQSIVITNNTHAKVMVQWLIPIVKGTVKKGEDDDHHQDSHGPKIPNREHQMITVDAAEKELTQMQAFSVSPAVGEIPPGSSMSFDICFCPKQSNRNFISELEAYVYFKNQRTFRLVNDHSLTPPWLLTPNVGEIAAESFVLVCVRFSPSEIKRYTDLLRLVINGDDGGRVVLEGQGAVPYLIVPDLLQDSTPYPEQILGIPHKPPAAVPKGLLGDLFMRPTSVGLTSQRTITLKNASRLPLRYRIALPSSAQNVLTITPMSGTLKGNDDIALKVVFSPKNAQIYNFAMNVSVFPLGGRAKRVLDSNQPGPVDRPEMLQHFTVNVQAQGEVGAITFDPPHTDIAGRIGARSRSRLVFTYKPCKSGLFDFSLYVKIRATATATSDGDEGDTAALVSNDEAIVMRLASTTMASMDDAAFVESIAQLPLTASIQARAAFPKLLFEDIRTESDLQISDVDYLWNRFSFARLNYDLSVPLTAKEIALNNSSSPDLSQLVAYPCEFAPAVLHSPTQTVDIVLRNHGYLETAFRMSLPNEKQLELENWCDEDEPSEALNRLICIIEELRLFSIEPKVGRLGPGESMVVRISYKHSSLKYQGLHNLPVLVRISQGKQFYLDIRGRTLAAQLPTNRRSSVRILDQPRGLQSAQGGSLMAPGTAGGGGGGVPSPHQSSSLVRTSGGGGGGGGSATSQGGSRGGEPLPNNGLPDILLVLGSGKVPENIVTLAPVPIGLSYVPTTQVPFLTGTVNDGAPLQRIELINVSAYHLQYEVVIGDVHQLAMTSDEYVRTTNHNLDVLTIANPRGHIASGSSVYLEWYFYPLEARPYQIPFYVRYSIVPPNASSSSTLFPLVEDLDNSFGGLGSPLGAGSAVGFSNTVSIAGNNGLVPPSRGGLATGQSLVKRGHTATSSRGGGSKGNNNNPSSRAQALLEKQAADAAAAAALAHTLIMTAQIHCVGYDPRVPEPKPHEAMYIGGLPPIRPVLESADKPVTCYEDYVDFGVLPQRALAHRVILLTNRSATGMFDFAVDTTSCSLCTDQLVTFAPLSGRIEPGGQAVIQVTMQAMTQSVIFVTEHVKIIVREVIKTAARSRGGTKAMLLNKLRARKAVATPHESVVSRVTVARTMYVLTEPELHVVDNGEMSATNQAALRAEQRPSGKFPTTVTEKGDVVAPDLAKSLRHTMGAAQANVTFADDGGDGGGGGGGSSSNLQNYGLGSGGYAETLQLQSTSGPPSPSERSVYSRTSRSAGTTLGGGGGGSVAAESRMSRQSASRASMESGGGRQSLASGGGGGSASGGGHQLFGSTYILMVRIKGAVYAAQTIDRLFARHNAYQTPPVAASASRPEEEASSSSAAAGALTRLSPDDEDRKHRNDTGVRNANRAYLQWCRADARDFLPPVGRKYFHDTVRDELARVRSKARVNIRQVFGRDAELRDVCRGVFDHVAKCLVGAFDVRDTLQDALRPADMIHASQPHQSATWGLLSLRHRSPLSATFAQRDARTCVAAVTGVYAGEVFAHVRHRALHQQLLVYLKRRGHSSKALAMLRLEPEDEDDADEDDAEPAELRRDRCHGYVDPTRREERWLRDEDTYALPVAELKEECYRRLSLGQSPAFVRDWERTETDLVQSARTNPPTARDSSVGGGGAGGATSLLVVKHWVYSLSAEARQALAAASVNSAAAAASLQPLPPPPPERALIALAHRPDFYATAADALNQLVLHVVRDLVDAASPFEAPSQPPQPQTSSATAAVTFDDLPRAS
eukprot:gene5515-3931_t